MAYVFVDIDNSLAVEGCYEQRKILSDLGAKWDTHRKVWNLAFTDFNLNAIMDRVDGLCLSSEMEDKVLEQQKKESKLQRFKDMSKQDTPVRLKIPGLKGSLYNYQRLGVMFSVLNGSGVLLADDMGLGKSLQAIATAVHLKSQGLARYALMVTPASLKWNWPLEIEKFTDEKYVVIDGAAEDRIAQWLRSDVFFFIVNYELIIEDLFGGKEITIHKDDEDHVRIKKELRIAKVQQRQRILSEVKNRVWDFMSLDECHAVRNHGARRTRVVKEIRSKFRMALTGTPMDGRLEELHSIMGFVSPGLLGSKARFFQRHVETDFYGKVTGYKRLGEVSQRIAPFFIRRLKKDVLRDLPDKIYENRVVALTREEMKLYKDIASGGHVATEDKEAIVACIRCKQFCNWPKQIDDGCKSSSKMDSFREILDEVIVLSGHKMLVFSQYKEMLDVIEEQALKKLGLKWLRIDGDTPKLQRASMQKVFNTDASVDLMLGTEAMSTGLNFTAADYVVNYDDNWSPSIMSQREDRCLAADTPVFCSSSSAGSMGLVRIQDIVEGDEVVSHVGRNCKVSGVRCHEHRGMITTIHYTGWYKPLVSTYDHKIFVKRGTSLLWVRAHEVMPSDSMAFPKTKDWHRLDRIAIQGGWRLFPEKLVECKICGLPVVCRQMCEGHYRKWVESNRGKTRRGADPCSNGRYKRLPDHIEIDDEWLRMMGWYAAEGFSSTKKGKGRFISLSGHQKEESILLGFGRTLDKIGVGSGIYRNKKTKGIELRAYSGELARWFMEWFGHRAENKKLPVEIMRLPPDQASVFLDGYTDGDGYQRMRQVEWVSASKTLCYQVCQLAIRSGFIPTMRKVFNREHKTYHYIGCYTVCWRPSNKRLADQDDNYIYRPVTSVETKNAKIKVYDLSVEDDHSFTTGFASVHNCHRIGQKNVVTVINFICKNTIEERIRAVIYGKNRITAQVLGDDTDELVLNRLNPKEIAKLL